MSRRRLPVCAALGLTCGVAVACSSSNDLGGSGGAGGIGGAGGEGGQAIVTAMLRVAHFAADVPAANATEVDFFVVGEGSFNSIGFGRVTQYGSVPVGPVVVEARALGGGALLATASDDLEAGGRYTFVAYRDRAEPSEMSLMRFDEEVSDLDPARGRVWVGHGVDDTSWATVQLILADAAEVPIAPLAFGEQAAPLDLDAGPHDLGFDTTPPSPTIDYGPFTIDVVGGETLILFAIDRDPIDESASAEVFPIRSGTTGTVDPLPVP